MAGLRSGGDLLAARGVPNPGGPNLALFGSSKIGNWSSEKHREVLRRNSPPNQPDRSEQPEPKDVTLATPGEPPHKGTWLAPKLIWQKTSDPVPLGGALLPLAMEPCRAPQKHPTFFLGGSRAHQHTMALEFGFPGVILEGEKLWA